MDRAAIFRPLLLSKKWRFARASSTSYKTFRKSMSKVMHFRNAEAFRAVPGVLETNQPLEKHMLEWDVLRPIIRPTGWTALRIARGLLSNVTSPLCYPSWFITVAVCLPCGSRILLSIHHMR